MTTLTWKTTRRHHGTYSGYRLHGQLNEDACDACYRAKEEYDARRRASEPARIKARRKAHAQNRAIVRLRHAHYDEWLKLYREERDKEFAE